METKTQKKKCECLKAYKNPRLKIFDIGPADVICASGCTGTDCSTYQACVCDGSLETADNAPVFNAPDL